MRVRKDKNNTYWVAEQQYLKEKDSVIFDMLPTIEAIDAIVKWFRSRETVNDVKIFQQITTVSDYANNESRVIVQYGIVVPVRSDRVAFERAWI